MTTARQGVAGKTRVCPHCRASILESATVCPACRHHLRFNAEVVPRASTGGITPFRVEGTIRHPAVGEAWEYSVLLSIKNEKGEEVSRQMVGVGALQSGEQRTFTLSVEVFAPKNGAPASKGSVAR
jgi:hypothetical protein